VSLYDELRAARRSILYFTVFYFNSAVFMRAARVRRYHIEFLRACGDIILNFCILLYIALVCLFYFFYLYSALCIPYTSRVNNVRRGIMCDAEKSNKYKIMY
jgi:hypothetical protein